MQPDERYRRLLLGHVDGVREHIVALADEAAPLARAWSMALAAALDEAEAGPQAQSDGAHEPPVGAAARVVQLVHLHRARRALLDFDASAGDGWLASAGRPGAGVEVSAPAFALEQRLANLDHGSSSAEPPAFDHDALRARATEAGDAATVIGLGVAQALAAELDGDFVDALAAARRASRMARTEAMPQQEYLANVVLARCRRLVGHPHLAARILRSLLGSASRQWRPWLAWELLLSGAIDDARELVSPKWPGALTTCPALIATSAVLELLDAAGEGDARAFDTAAERLRASTAVSRRLGLDAEALLGALDARADLGSVGGPLRRWATGEEAAPPRGLHGLAAAVAGSAEMKGALVFVAAGPEGGRRLLMPGSKLLAGQYHTMTQSQRQQGRMDTMVAALALAGPGGVETADLFRRVYGFDFDPDIHHGALRKLLARVEQWLGPRGALGADESRRRLELRAPILVADPRCAPPVDVRVLGMLATQGSTSAREAARRLEVPLRTAQAALQSLLADGSCLRVRRGNLVAYEIEDTTFSEPTRH